MFESFQTQAKEAEAATKLEKKDEPTLKEIRANKEDENNLGLMLLQEGSEGTNIADLIAHPEKMQKGDLRKIEKQVKKFNEKMAGANEISGAVSAETIAEFAKSSPELQAAIALGGKEETAQVVEKLLRRVAVDDPDRFKKIYRNFNTWKSYEATETKRLNDSFEKLRKENNLDMTGETFAKIMQNPDKDTRFRELRKEVKQSFGFWRSALNFASFGYISRGITREFVPKAGVDPRDEFMRVRSEIQKRQEKVGKGLGLMFDENPEVRAAIMAEISAEKAQKRPEATLKEAKNSLLDEKNFDTGWQENVKNIKDWGRKSPAEQNTEFQRYKNAYEASAQQRLNDKGGGSAWEKILMMLLQMFLGRKAMP